MLRARILEALGGLLRPIVLLLLKSGITWRDFSELAKATFVQVASDEFGIRGRPTNRSRVAILTGIDRREVRRLRLLRSDQPAPALGFMSKPTQVLDGWFHDPLFTTAAGGPKTLHASDGEDSFAALVRRYAPGIPPVAMIKELRAAGSIESLPDGRLRPLKRSYIPRELAADQVRLWGSVLKDVGAVLEHNLMRGATARPRFERRALRLSVDRRAVQEFEAFLAVEGQQFLERIDDWLAAHQVAEVDSEHAAAVRLGVGLYQIFDAPRHGKSSVGGDMTA